MTDNDYYLLLKWGTIKGYKVPQGRCLELLSQFYKDGKQMSAMADRPNEERRKILCDLIDAFPGTITNDWSGKDMNKEEAKKYIMEYDT